MNWKFAFCTLIIYFLSFESLGVVIPVTNNNDAGPGSLREAVTNGITGDIVDMTGIAGTITLTSGEINIPAGKHLTFNGPGAGVLSISGNNTSRILYLQEANISINNVTLENGFSLAEGGAAIHAHGNGIIVNIQNCIFRNNLADGPNPGNRGGALFLCSFDVLNPVQPTTPIQVTINNCQFENNAAYIGGALVFRTNSGVQGSTCTITNTTFKLNQTGTPNNLSGNDGGAVEVVSRSGDSFNVENCTFSENHTTGPFNARSGGAISIGTVTATIQSSTFVNNTSPNEGGAIAYWGSGGSCTIINCLFQDNSAPTGPDLLGAFVSGGFNIVSTTGGYIGLTQPSDQLNVSALVLPLAQNGGFGETHGIECNSPAIDAGGGNPFLDQRGLPRVCGADVGAYEYQTPCNCTPTMDSVYICFGDSLRTDGIYQSTPGVYGDTTLFVISSNFAVTTPMCLGDPQTTLVSDSSGGLWSGTGITDVNLGTFDPVVAGVGVHTITYTLSYTINGSLYSCSTEHTIEVISTMDASITQQTPLCLSDPSVTLTPAIGGGTWSGIGITNPNQGIFDPSTAGAGTHQVIYEVSTSPTCFDSDTIEIIVQDAQFQAQTPMCIWDASVNLTATTPGGSWSGTGITATDIGTFDPNTAGAGSHTINYTVNTLVNGISYTCTTDQTIDVMAPTDPTINSAGPYCENNPPVTLSAASTGGAWSGAGITDPNTGTFTPAIAGEGTHQIIYTTGGNNCLDADTITISVLTAPTANAGQDNTILAGTSTTISGSGGGNYAWSPSDGLSCTDCASPEVIIYETTTYIVKVTNSNGCTDYDSVTIFRLEEDFFVPNIFSPNGDNNNDVFEVKGSNLNNFSIEIFNRWGELIFQSTDQNEGWDGTQNGQPLNSGVFAYVISFIDNSGTTQVISGNITLIEP